MVPQKRKWLMAGIVVTISAFAIGWAGLFQLFGPDLNSERLKQTHELLALARQYPRGEFPGNESIPAYLRGIGPLCWTFLQQRVAADPNPSVASVMDKSANDAYQYVQVQFTAGSWIKFIYYRGQLFSRCETSGL